MIYQNRIHRFKQNWQDFNSWMFKQGRREVCPQYTVEEADDVFSLSNEVAKELWERIKTSWKGTDAIFPMILDIEKIFALPEPQSEVEELKAKIRGLRRKSVFYEGGEEFITPSRHGRFYEASEVLVALGVEE